MSEPTNPPSGVSSESLERAPEEVLAAARPLDPYEGPVFGDLTDEEDRIFFEAVVSA